MRFLNHLFLFTHVCIGWAQNLESDLEMKLKGVTNPIEYVNNLNQLAAEYYEINQEKAIWLVKKAMHLSDSIGYEKGVADAYFSKSLIAKINYDYLEELECTLNSLSIYKKLDDQESIARAYNTMGQIHYQQFDFDLSRVYFDRAINIFQSINDLEGQARVLRRVGNIKLLTQDYDSAFKFYESSLTLERELKNKVGIAACLNNLGVILFETGKYNEALDYHFKALDIEIFENIQDRIPSSYHNIGQVFLAQNKLIEALNYSERGLTAAQKFKNIDSQIEIYLLRSEVYSKQGNYKLAISDLIKHNALKDSMHVAETRLKVAQMEALLSNKRSSLLEQEQAAANYASQLSRSRLSIVLLVSSLVIIIGALVIILLYLRSLRSSKKIKERELDLTNTQRNLINYKLAAIHSQMNPHFIFNALNSIQSSIIAKDNETAYNYLSKFSKLLRNTLAQPEKHHHSLLEEIKLIELYLQLEQLRFNDFQYEINVDESVDAENTMVPCMLVQPLVENAFKHGLSTKIGEKRIDIRIYIEAGSLFYLVEDNGIGRERASRIALTSSDRQNSLGMQLVKSKLDFNNDGACLEVIDLYDENKLPRGTRVIVKVGQMDKGLVYD